MMFKDFLGKLIFDEGVKETETKIEPEQQAFFNQSLTESSDANNGEEIIAKAKQIIADSQAASDADEFPDITKVQDALDTAGSKADSELIRKILINYEKCNPEDIKKDGEGRKAAILAAIEQTKAQAMNLKNSKAEEEVTLVQASQDAETTCTKAITEANLQSEQAIQEERRIVEEKIAAIKAASEETIANIRATTQEAIAAANEERDNTLNYISEQRMANENTVKCALQLAEKVEEQGTVVINQIDIWLTYLN